jgi:hypothetical protein
MKCRRMGWVGNVAFMTEEGGSYRVWCGNLRESDHSRGQEVDGSKMLK